MNEENDIMSLDGVGVTTGDKLLKAGYETIEALASADPKKLSTEMDCSESVARKMIYSARDKCDMGFTTANELEKERKKIHKMSTGFEDLDNLLKGGFESGVLTEIFAEFGAGKTQIAHMMAARAATDPNEKNPIVFYIDTEGSFRPNRVRDFLKGLDYLPENQEGFDDNKTEEQIAKKYEKYMKRILTARAVSVDQQKYLVDKASRMIKEDKLNVTMVIVDSLTSHFRAEYIGRGTLADRQQTLNSHMHQLMRLAESNNIVVYVTNQVMAKPDSFFGDPTAAIGGHIVGHNSSCRMYLRKGRKGSRVIKLIDSPDLPDGEVMFYITESNLEGLK